MTKQEIFTVIQQIIAEQTGNHVEDIVGTTHLQDELGILGQDFARIVNSINEALKITLSASEIEEESETVNSLVTIAFEESELG
ncbi:MAG: phosphopantetheine-binding protein [Microgenomates group bacterium]